MNFIIITLLALLHIAIAGPVSLLQPNSIYSGSYMENAEELSGQFEGDILLNPEQERMTKGEASLNGLINTVFRWPGRTVIYEMWPHFNLDQTSYIRHAMNQIEAVTCIRFRPRTNEFHYVEITGADAGCYAHVGYAQIGRQIINLYPNALNVECFRFGTILHELLHALGFFHMHSSSDRENFVSIQWDNIQEDQFSAFEFYHAYDISHFGGVYDLGSVMHYSSHAFSKNGLATILPWDISQSSVMGQRIGLSEGDIVRLGAMYQCS